MARRAIVLGITADIAFAAGALLASILAQDADFDADVVILHDGLEATDQAAFLRLWPRCRFRLFTRADVEARLRIPVGDARVQAYFQNLTPMVLAKLELPDLLADHDRVVWLDADMLVRGPLKELWDFECLAWRPLPPGAFARRSRVLEAFADRRLDPEVPLLNGGAIGVARGFAERGGSCEVVHRFARELIERVPRTQLAEMPWYLTAATLGLPVTSWSMRFNHSVASPGVAEATVIHAIGPHKFWNATPLRHLFPDWLLHQAAWVRVGGRPYTGPVLLAEAHPDEASEVLRSAEARSYWLGIFDQLRPVLPKGMLVDLRHDRGALRILIHGLPEGEHLRLYRLPNPRRLGLELHLLCDMATEAAATVARDLPNVRQDGNTSFSPRHSEIGAVLAAIASVLP